MEEVIAEDTAVPQAAHEATAAVGAAIAAATVVPHTATAAPHTATAVPVQADHIDRILRGIQQVSPKHHLPPDFPIICSEALKSMCITKTVVRNTAIPIMEYLQQKGNGDWSFGYRFLLCLQCWSGNGK